MRSILVFAFVLVAVLGPPVNIGSGLPPLRPELLVIAVALAIGHTKLDFRGDVPRLLAGFAVTAMVAISASYTVFSVSFDKSDFSIFPMLVQYWLVYCFGTACVRNGVRSGLLWAVVLAVSISAGIAIIQKLNLFGVNEWLTPLYVDPNGPHAFIPQWLASGSSSSRAIGTVGDPRHCAMMFGYGVSAVVALLLGKGVLTPRLVLMAALGMIGAGLLVTYSRTGILASSGAIAVGLWLVVRRGRSATIPLLLASMAILAVLFVSSRLGVVEEDSRLSMGVGEMVDTSGYARIRDTLKPFQSSLENPLILITGMGPSKAVLGGSEHGETGWLVLRYGLIGFFIYVAMVRRSVRRCMSVHLAGGPREAVLASFVLQGITVWMIFFLAESIFKLAQIMSMNMLLLGAVAGVRIQSAGKAASRRREVSRKARRSTESQAEKDKENRLIDPDLHL